MNPSRRRTLVGAVARDLSVLALFAAVFAALDAWYVSSGSWPSAVVLGVVAFVIAYATCYLMHEWGHWIGARLAGAKPPLGPMNSVLLPLFDPRAHTRTQFQALSLGGVLAYVITMVGFVAALRPELGSRALALGAVAFVVQSLAVDLPIIAKVQRGADIVTASTQGAAPAVILRRTAIGWSGLAAIVVAMAVLS